MARYKLKTRRIAKKRFKITATGKILRMKGLRSHLRRKKPARTKRQFDQMLPLAPCDRRRIRRLLPHAR